MNTTKTSTYNQIFLINVLLVGHVTLSFVQIICFISWSEWCRHWKISLRICGSFYLIFSTFFLYELTFTYSFFVSFLIFWRLIRKTWFPAIFFFFEFFIITIIIIDYFSFSVPISSSEYFIVFINLFLIYKQNYTFI